MGFFVWVFFGFWNVGGGIGLVGVGDILIFCEFLSILCGGRDKWVCSGGYGSFDFCFRRVLELVRMVNLFLDGDIRMDRVGMGNKEVVGCGNFYLGV